MNCSRSFMLEPRTFTQERVSQKPAAARASIALCCLLLCSPYSEDSLRTRPQLGRPLTAPSFALCPTIPVGHADPDEKLRHCGLEIYIGHALEPPFEGTLSVMQFFSPRCRCYFVILAGWRLVCFILRALPRERSWQPLTGS